MKTIIAIVILLLVSLPAYGQASEDDRRANTPIEPFHIIGNIYYVGAAEVTSFLIVTPRGHILIDSGFAETVPQIRANVKKLGFKLDDIKIMLNTQAHFDHAGGFAQLKKLTGAQMVASLGDKPGIENGGRNDFTWGDTLPFEGLKVDRVIRDGDTVKLGGVTLRAILTPGHTRGCTTWTYRFTAKGESYTAVFVGSTSSPGYTFYGNKKYPRIIADFEHTFAVLKKLRPDLFFASHGSFFDLLGKAEKIRANAKVNPFIDPDGYREFVTSTERTFREKLAKERKASKQRQPQTP